VVKAQQTILLNRRVFAAKVKQNLLLSSYLHKVRKEEFFYQRACDMATPPQPGLVVGQNRPDRIK